MGVFITWFTHTHSSHAHKNGSSLSDRNRSGSEEISGRSENVCGKRNAIRKKNIGNTNHSAVKKQGVDLDPEDPQLYNLLDP
jgi:hypothetical protein